MSGPRPGRPVESLAILILSSFIASFLVTRTFTTLFPSTVVVTGGIHFHHFWYGLMMVVSSGWLAIVSNRPDLDRIYAIVFGLGTGLIGDEVGLLLTLGDYRSGLTYVFFVGVLSVSVLGIMFYQYREALKRDLIDLERGIHVAQFGVFVAGLSAIAFAFNHLKIGSVVLVIGVVIIVVGLFLRRAQRRRQAMPA